jgi:hypothetical protein
MQALAVSCEELHARTGNPPLLTTQLLPKIRSGIYLPIFELGKCDLGYCDLEMKDTKREWENPNTII